MGAENSQLLLLFCAHTIPISQCRISLTNGDTVKLFPLLLQSGNNFYNPKISPKIRAATAIMLGQLQSQQVPTFLTEVNYRIAADIDKKYYTKSIVANNLMEHQQYTEAAVLLEQSLSAPYWQLTFIDSIYTYRRLSTIFSKSHLNVPDTCRFYSSLIRANKSGISESSDPKLLTSYITALDNLIDLVKDSFNPARSPKATDTFLMYNLEMDSFNVHLKGYEDSLINFARDYSIYPHDIAEVYDTLYSAKKIANRYYRKSIGTAKAAALRLEDPRYYHILKDRYRDYGSSGIAQGKNYGI